MSIEKEKLSTEKELLSTEKELFSIEKGKLSIEKELLSIEKELFSVEKELFSAENISNSENKEILKVALLYSMLLKIKRHCVFACRVNMLAVLGVMNLFQDICL